MKPISTLLALIIILSFFNLHGQTVLNAYARVRGISTVTGGSSLTVSNFYHFYNGSSTNGSSTSGSFKVGDPVIIMQMQDNVISGINNDNSFGLLSGSTQSVGYYEIRKIISINGISTVGYAYSATDLYTSTTASATIVVGSLQNTYSPRTATSLSQTDNSGSNRNSSVQLISFTEFANYSTSSDIIAPNWDGNTGGVIAINVSGTLTLNNDINADGVGFRGGVVSSNNNNQDCTSGSSSTFRSNTNNSGEKGEGVYRRNITTYRYGRARIVSGGGGGGDSRSGGGGGSNWSSGGNGRGCNATNGFGYGGVELSAVISTNRIFMGGGGGGGRRTNNNLGTGSDGGNGGGIILIRAHDLLVPCPSSGVTSHSISANGNPGGTSSQDGSGGGGAAGSIVLDIQNPVNSPCYIMISADGGDGGDGGTAASASAGGGGGAGLIQINLAENQLTNVSVNSDPGVGGTANSGSNNGASGGAVSGNANIIFNSNTPLPVQLTFFNALLLENETVQLAWQTAAEINSAHFTVEKSIDGVNWEEVRKVKAAGNSTEELNYTILDKRPFDGVSYYRLSQTDLDGQAKDLGIRSILRDGEEIIVFPNPAEGRIEFQGPIGSFEYVALYDVLGNNIMSSVSFDQVSERQLTLNIDPLESGIYFLKTKDEIIRFVKK